MSRLRLSSSIALAGIVVAAALAVVTGTGAARDRPSPTVRIGPTHYGRIVVDGHGRTLYLFTRERGSRSDCYGACARAWPPYLVHGSLTAGRGLRQSLLGTARRRDGSRQVTYAGHPLYHFAAERHAGEVFCQNANEYGGDWLIVNPDGTANRSAG